MDDPVRDIHGVVRKLCQGDPDTQARAIDTYFTNNAAFTHPFVRTNTFQTPAFGSRHLVHFIFRWYKIMSPHIDLDIKSVAYDADNLLLYVTIHQIFRIWALPGHKSDVTLTTVLQLTHNSPNTLHFDPRKFYILSQNDLYQTDQFVRFFLPWFGIGPALVYLWQYVAAFFCVLGCFILWPVTRWEQQKAESEKISSRAAGKSLAEAAQQMVNGEEEGHERVGTKSGNLTAGTLLGEGGSRRQ